MPQSPHVWIMAPTLNEAANIGALISGIEAQIPDYPHTICIVDDASTDGTLEILRRLKQTLGLPNIVLIERVKAHAGSQRGSALWLSVSEGLRKPEAEIFVEMDADLSHRPEELRTGIQMVHEGVADFAIASKYLRGSQVINRPWARRMVSRVANTAVRALLSRRIHDYSNGYRFYNRACAEIIGHHKYRYGSPIYLTEIAALLLKCGVRMSEFPTLYVGRNEGISKLRFIDLVKAAIAILDIARFFYFASHLDGARTKLEIDGVRDAERATEI